MRHLTFLLAVAACGGNGNHPMPDAAPPPCDYTEAADGTNNTMAEASGLTIGGLTQNICGQVDGGHYEMGTQIVDVDKFRIDVGQGVLLVRAFGDSSSLGALDVMIFDTNANPTLKNGVTIDSTLGDHAVFTTSLAEGTYDVWVVARASADISTPVPYKVRFVPDDPTMRCPTVTDPPAYTEAHDNADNLGNDVVSVDFGKSTPYALTTSTTDAPETSGVTLGTDKPARISGSSANVMGTDEYMDRDTFQLTTDAMTNEIALRINWPAGSTDMDAILFAENQMVATGSAVRSGNDGNELTSFAVKPSTSYWLWVGAVKGSTGLPAAYDVSLCGSNVQN